MLFSCATKTTKIKSTKRQIILILFGFVIVIGLLVGISVIGLSNLAKVTANLTEIVEVNNAKVRLITTMRDAIRERMLQVHTILYLDDPFDIEEQWEVYSAYAREFLKAREELIALGLTLEQEVQIEEQRQYLHASVVRADAIIALAKKESLDKEIAAPMLKEVQLANQRVLDELSEMRNYQYYLASESVKHATAEYRDTRQNVLSLLTFAVITCVLVILFVVSRIRCQALALNKALDELEENNQTLEARVQERTEELLATRADNMRMGAELKVSRRIQRMLMPSKDELKNLAPTLDISGHMESTDEVSGDYFDVLQTADKIVFTVGDVVGHGLESGVLMLIAQTALRTMMHAGLSSPEQCMDVLNRTLFESTERMRSEKGMTVALLYYQEGRVTICGQHEEVLVVRNNGEVECIDTINLGFVVGLTPKIGHLLDTASIQLNVGDGVVLYTDGITEAFNQDNEMYGLERLCAVVSRHWQLSAYDIQQAVLDDVHQHMATQQDDITLLIVKRGE
jgi:serine phosphatase RsbU (regulator of sigma subunit)